MQEQKETRTDKGAENSGGNPFIKIIVNVVMVVVIGILALLVWQRFANGQAQASFLRPTNVEEQSAPDDVLPEAVGGGETSLVLSPYNSQDDNRDTSIGRMTDFETNIPARPRTDVTTYIVKKGDTLFEIADKFGIKPETLLFGNYDVLKDNPHLLSPEMELNILPTDGAYYTWKEGDNLANVAYYYNVETQEIIGYSGNAIDLTTLDSDNQGIEPGIHLIIPGGTRPIKDWGPPAITRENPASARYYGAGHCGSVYTGAVGTGTFVWPTVSRYVGGYAYSSIHPAIDITGSTGDAIFASDSGVVVYSGWSNYGYGYLIVLDHGNGFQTAYAHLSAVGAHCGQSVFQGGVIGALGSTGNSSGPHLHFELIYNGAKPNPLNYLP